MRYYTITTEDVGSAHIRAFGYMWPVQDFLGRILPGDVGKRVYQRAGILQVENDEQYGARMAAVARPGFDDDVAWLKFMDDRDARAASGPTTPQSQRELRLMRIAFDWAMKYPTMTTPSATEADTPRCECTEGDCAPTVPKPLTPNVCGAPAVLHLFRVTMMVHETPTHDDELTVFCEPCGDKALESGAFCVGNDLLEPNHGPGCIERMYADVNEEGGQS